jgi:hypothetical protein
MVATDRRIVATSHVLASQAGAQVLAWDVFNVTNSVRFDTIEFHNNGSDDGGFGLYSGTLTNPRVQRFSLRLTF